MNPASTISFHNRSIDNFSVIINDIIGTSYNRRCRMIQKAIHDLYRNLQKSSYDGCNTEYQLENTTGFWIETIAQREVFHQTAFLSVGMDNSLVRAVVPENVEVYKNEEIKDMIQTCLANADYCNMYSVQYVGDFLRTIFHNSKETHLFEFHAEDGTLIFKAIPKHGKGTIHLVSRSQEAVIASDAESMEQMKAMGYKMQMDTLSRH